MEGEAQKGWLMLLSDSPDSDWGAVDDFYAAVEFDAGKGESLTLESEVWGRLQRKGMMPRRGDGIGFYHTSRARFPARDPHRRRPRISLIGELLGIQQEGLAVTHLSARIQRSVLKRLREHPIVRDESTDALFRRCGMVPGSVATFYEAPPAVWAEFRARAGLRASPMAPAAETSADSELEAFEGEKRRLFSLHRSREGRLRTAKIESALAASADRRLRWEVPGCGFDFEATYGAVGRAFAEVHHLRPLADRTAVERTRLADLAIVCANCHRMIHRGGANRPMSELIRVGRAGQRSK